MKNKIFYALFCTTFITPNISLGAQDQVLSTPEKIEQKKKKLHIDKGYDTPKLEEKAKKKYEKSLLATPTRLFLQKVEIDLEKAKRPILFKDEYHEINQSIVEEKVETEQKKQEDLRKEESKRNEEVIKQLENQTREEKESFDKKIEDLTKDLEKVSLQLEDLSTEKQRLESEMTKSQEITTSSTQALTGALQNLQSAIVQKTADEAEAQRKILNLQAEIRKIQEDKNHHETEKEKLLNAIQGRIGKKTELPSNSPRSNIGNSERVGVKLGRSTDLVTLETQNQSSSSSDDESINDDILGNN